MAYATLAKVCLKRKLTLFGFQPKYHQVAHFLQDMLKAIRAGHRDLLNPLVFGSEMCEDLVGKTCRISRRVSPRLQNLRTLQLVLIKAKSNLNKIKRSRLRVRR